MSKINLLFEHIRKNLSIENIKKGIQKAFRKAFSRRNVFRNIIDAAIALLILFTFFGEYIVGQNLHIDYFLIVMAVYLTYNIYKWICHIQDLYANRREKKESTRNPNGKYKKNNSSSIKNGKEVS